MKLFLYIITLILMLISTYAALIYAPTETIMGNIQRIFYFHMGTVWVATIAFMIVFVASIFYLINGKKKWDVLAYTSAEIGVLFITLTIITGSIWAKPVWGTWWTCWAGAGSASTPRDSSRSSRCSASSFSPSWPLSGRD